MSKTARRIAHRPLLFAAFVVVFVLVATWLYMLGMRHLEGAERSFWRAMMTVVESMTTVGYGFDSDWRHPLMNVFVIFLQLSGIFLLLTLFPLFFLPFVEHRFELRLPLDAPDLSDHVVVCSYSQAVSSLLPELARHHIPSLVLEEDEAQARRLHELGQRVVHRVLDDDALLTAGLMRARALIGNGPDAKNAVMSLTARQLGYAGEILTLVEDPTYIDPMLMAGSSEVFAPRHLLAAALAARASERVSPTIAGAHQLGAHLEIQQIRVQAESPLAGVSLGDSGIGARTGAVVIGQWLEGRLETAITAESIIRPRGILVVAGSHESIDALMRLAEGARRLARQGPFVVVGGGEVGSQVIELLRQAGDEVRVVDRREGKSADVVGDILDPAVIEAAGVGSAQAAILAIDSDSATLFATVVIRGLCSRVPILARVNETENLEKLYRAGADFALSFAQVAGSLLAHRLLGLHAFELDPQLKLLKVEAGPLAGRHPGELDIRGKSGCSIIAIERDGQLTTALSEDFRFFEDDLLYVCGTQQAIMRFQDSFSV